MADFINYYAELDLNNDLSTKEIIEKLVQLERVWHQREIIQPEKAREMLVLIDKAKHIFENDGEKDRYDNALEKALNNSNLQADNSHNELFKKYYSKFFDFYKNDQLDLAKATIDKALSYYDKSQEDDEFLYYVAEVYFLNKCNDVALNYINEAIIISNKWEYHFLKGQILTPNHDYKKVKDEYETAAQIAQSCGNTDGKGRSFGMLAIILFYQLFDFDSAENAARSAIENDDPLGYGKIVLEQLNNGLNECEVTLNEFLNYENERFVYSEQIKKMVSLIINEMTEQNLEKVLLSEKHGVYEHDTSEEMDDEDYTYQIYLLQTGDFKCITQTSKFYNNLTVNHGIYQTNSIKEKKYNKHSDVLIEFDFIASCRWEGPEILQYYELCETVLVCVKFTSRPDNFSYHIRRIGKKKGIGLYCKLKEVYSNLLKAKEEKIITNEKYKKEEEKQQICIINNRANTESTQYQINQKVSTQKTELKQKQIDEEIEFENKRRDAISDIVDKYDSDLEEWLYEDEFYYCPQCHKELERYSVYDDKIWLCSCGYDILEEVLSEKTHDNEVQDNISDNTTDAEEQGDIQDNIFDNTTDIEEQEDVNDNSAWNWKKDFVYWMLVVFLYAMLCAMTESYTSSLIISVIVGLVGYYIVRKRKNKK